MTGRLLWRFSNFKDLSGIGGTRVSGRWHRRGQPVVYLADCPATALLEVLVHFELSMDELPEAFTLLQIELPADVSEENACANLPARWSEDSAITRRIGDTWLKDARTLLLRVPTVIVPYNCNYLFNPLHPEAVRAKLNHLEVPGDPRLFQSEDPPASG